jgi:oligosaccharide repeat unit polymerase
VFAYVSILLGLYVRKKYKFLFLFVLVVSVANLYLHGSKTPIINLCMMVLLYYVYVENVRIGIFVVAISGMLLTLCVSAFFLYTFSIGLDQVVFAMIGYSDYSRNALKVMGANIDFGWGLFLLEGEFYTRVPRFLFEAKPSDFGYLKISKLLFPELFSENKGAPSLGIGDYFADFGYFGVFVIALLSFFKGMFLKFFRIKIFFDGSIYYFIPFIFLSGVAVYSVGVGWAFIEHISLSFFLYFLIRARWVSK